MDGPTFKFDSGNKRMALDCDKPVTVMAATGALFVGSVFLYSKNIFKLDRNATNFMMFTAGSALASYGWADFALGNAEHDAGRINNERESTTI